MRKQIVILYVLLVLIFPQLLLSIVKTEVKRNEATDDFISEVKTAIISEKPSRTIHVYDEDILLEMPLDTYVTGVVLAEMPADFEPEALKAQAVACRTFALKSMQRSKHKDAFVCTDPTCCQAFISPSEYTGSENNLEKVYLATKETENEVLMFDGNLIEATYFSCSGGKTEADVEVWGADVPYLQSVESPGEEISSNYETTKSFTHANFKQMLGLPQSMNLNEMKMDLTYTEGGGIETLKIGDSVYSGVQVRSLLSLRSTIFSIEHTDDCVLITTKGYGHRVGMSQYGAEAMAVAGAQYDEILQHYYLGTDLARLSVEEMDTIFDKAENI